MPKHLAAWLLITALTTPTLAADWPTSRGDAARSGYTADELPRDLGLAWTRLAGQPPQPAWPRDDRMLFDRAFEVVVAGGKAFFGSSADCRVTALDAATGDEAWSFFTDAPVRFAPAVWKDRLFVVSDDGCLYCLAAADGALIQKWRGGPRDELILGNGRMVSRWPARGGPVIVGDVVYWAAGVWQSEGIFIQAIDATTGELIWRNDTAGSIYMPQPHGGANAESGVSAQGHLVAAGDILLLPTGRAVPAGFSRADGQFLYYHLQANGHAGGTQTVAIGNSFYNGGIAFRTATGVLQAKLGPGPVAKIPGGVIYGNKGDVRAVHTVEKMMPDRKGVPTKTLVHAALWTAKTDASAALIVAGKTIVAGGGKTVTLIDLATHEVLDTKTVDGIPYALAVANGRLYVSTDQGTIYCFANESQSKPAIHRGPQPRPRLEKSRLADAAEEILRRSNKRDGFCLDLDCGDGELALALAERSNLQIYALLPTPEGVAAARKKLHAAGVYGTRVTVHLGDAEHHTYGKYFADLVVSSRSLTDGPLAIDADDPPSVLRPFGGIACTGKPGAMQIVERGALANTGSWTHQYADLGNTGCSTDDVVKGNLQALWFRDVDLLMPSRHGRGPAPVYYQGRMFVEGINALRAVDAYNGRNLWEFPLENILAAYNAEHLSGTAVTGSNLCLAGDRVYIHDKHKCFQLDAATGRKLAEYPAPKLLDGRTGLWGYIACDGKLLYGSLVNPQHQVRYAYGRSNMSELWGESSALLALDPESGEVRWRYDAQQSIRNNAIAIGGGSVFLIDRAIADEDKWDPADRRAKLPPVTVVKHPPGRLVKLDAASGKVLWNVEKDIFGTMLSYSADHDALLMGYLSTRFKLPSEVGGRIAVHQGSTGERLWEKKATYTTRPLINDRKILAQGGSWDLLTGEDQPFDFKRSYGCGQLAGSKHMLLFRSATLGYFDLTRGSGTENYGGIRPGCWINALPVGGLVLVPDASAGCQCSYQNRSWMALEGR